MAKASRSPTNNAVVSIGDVFDGEGLNKIPAGVDEPYYEDEESSEFEDEQLSSIEVLRTQLGDSPDQAKISIFRVVELRKKEPYLFETTPDDLSFENIMTQYGGGKFRVTGVWPKGLKRKGYFINRVIELETPPNWAPPAPPMVVERKDGSANNNEVVLSAINSLGLMIKDALTAVIQSTTKPQRSRKEEIEEMLLMKQLFAPAETAPRQEKDALGELDKMLSIKTKLDALGGGGGEGSYLAVMTELAKPLISAVQAQAETKRIELQRQPALPNPIQSTEPVREENGEPRTPTGGMEMNMMIGVILNAARNDSDPISYANLILDAMPESMVSQFVDDPHWFDKLCVAAPDCKQYEPWFREVHQEMLNLLTPDAETDNDATNSTAENPPNASGQTG